MIIKDFTDNDLYKFTTMNAIQKKFPDAEVVYRFVNREFLLNGIHRCKFVEIVICTNLQR